MSAALDLTEAERARILAKSAPFRPAARAAGGRAARTGRACRAPNSPPNWPRSARRRSAPSSSGTGSTIAARPISPACPPSPGRCSRSWPSSFVIGRPEAAAVQTSADDTRKFLFRFRDGQEAETVYIPDRQEDRGAVCISSPGRLHAVLPLLPHRHAGAGAQPRRRRDRRPVHGGPRQLRRMAQPAAARRPRLLSTIVLMGMGEPLYNYENVAKAMTIVMDGEGIAPVPPPHHAVHLRRGADDGPRRRGTRRQPRRLAARRPRRTARRTRAAQPQISDRRADRRLPPLSRRPPMRGASPSNTSC